MPATTSAIAPATVETSEVDGRERRYLLVRPAAPTPGAPLVLVLHGSGQSADKVRAATGGALDALAGAGAVVVYLQAWRGGWNDARAATKVPARREGVDDVAYVAAVVDAVAASAGADPAKVCALGFSAGGQMVLRVLHQAPELISCAVVIGASQPAPGNFVLPSSTGPAAVPRPVVLVHGTADPIAPYGGGTVSFWGLAPRGRSRSALGGARYLAARNGVEAEPTTTSLPHQDGRDGTSVTRTQFASPGHQSVVLYSVHGGGHTIPGPKAFPRLIGRTTQDITAAGLVADLLGLTLPPSGSSATGSSDPVDRPVRQVVVAAAGPPEVMALTDVERPRPGRGQVLIATEAAGVALGDVQRRQGTLAGNVPWTPGYDVVGRVLAAGPAVAPPQVGQRVAAFVGTGGYATEVLAEAQRCVVVPEDLDAAKVCALVLNYATAWQMLHRVAHVAPGGSILVTGAAGGVGSALVELAALDGITVHGTASPARGAALAARGVHVLGAVEELTDPVDATFDSVGGPSLALSRRVTARSGTVVAYGFTFAAARGLSPWRTNAATAAALVRARLTPGPRTTLFVIVISIPRDPAAFRADLSHLVRLLETGKIDPQVQRVPLDQVADAHRALEARRVTGKLVLVAPGADA